MSGLAGYKTCSQIITIFIDDRLFLEIRSDHIVISKICYFVSGRSEIVIIVLRLGLFLCVGFKRTIGIYYVIQIRDNPFLPGVYIDVYVRGAVTALIHVYGRLSDPCSVEIIVIRVVGHFIAGIRIMIGVGMERVESLRSPYGIIFYTVIDYITAAVINRAVIVICRNSITGYRQIPRLVIYKTRM